MTSSMSHRHVSRLCVLMWHDSSMWHRLRLSTWHDSSKHVSWPICFTNDSFIVWYDAFMFVTHDSFMYVWHDPCARALDSHVHDSCIRVTWLIHTCDMTHAYVWHDSCIRVTWLMHTCDMTHAYVWHDPCFWVLDVLVHDLFVYV